MDENKYHINKYPYAKSYFIRKYVVHVSLFILSLYI